MSTLSDLQAELTEINTAITKILTGAQSYELDDGQVDQRVERPDIKVLYQRKKEIQWEIASLDRSGGFYGY